MAGKYLTLTTENWETEVTKNPNLVLVDFWADWCGPCRMIAPAFEALSEEYEGKVVFGKLDTEAQGSIAQKYEIMTIPTFKIFRNGEEVKQLIGPRNKEHLKQFIDECL